MRKAYLMLVIAACAVSPFALAQSRDTSVDSPSTVVANTVQAQTADATAERASTLKVPKSAFGQVMAVLTHFLQEAAVKQAAATQANASIPNMSPDNSALTITVTPIAGQSTFTPVENTDAAIPASVNAGTAIDPQTGNSTQLATQTEDGGAG